MPNDDTVVVGIKAKNKEIRTKQGTELSKNNWHFDNSVPCFRLRKRLKIFI